MASGDQDGENRFPDSATVVVTDDQISSSVSDEEVILQVDSGIYYGTNAVGRQIWDQIQEPQRVEDIVTTIASEYDIDESKASRDVRAFLEELHEAELISIRENDDQ